ncbi:hypothetical protein CS022_10330 [Veronia nyctiphanis]|uniref:Lactoylglutathione lyase n=1 Tax=Veronia nyctiphanis TaxID=1278244 RepID=A0A4Q0YWG3_9GAMM|nr:hypothetical protein [Veronia nyctiphanis]RXJ73361.1 hypothetical protein CS022_10330 [Veronia nyctiphanis]
MKHLDALVLYVGDLAVSTAFYERLFSRCSEATCKAIMLSPTFASLPISSSLSLSLKACST